MTRRQYDRDRYQLPREPRARGPLYTPETTRLRPARDAGIELGDRRQPIRRPRRRSRRPSRLPLVLGALLVLAAVGGALLIPHAASKGAEGKESAHAAAYSVEALPDPTPAFATYRSLRIHLPLLPEDVTAIGFHQASGNDALHTRSLVPDIDMADADKGRAQLKPVAAREAQEGVTTVLQGGVLRMWRSNRSGKPDSACDVGGKPGTQVYSPVTGTVSKVVRYKLYSKYGDYEIHITPDGWPEVDVVLIHVDNVAVKDGQRVEAGATPLAAVRKLSDRVTHQLGHYTGDGGDHVHVQLNRVEVPGKLGTVGES